jgi:hypothetical protein
MTTMTTIGLFQRDKLRFDDHPKGVVMVTMVVMFPPQNVFEKNSLRFSWDGKRVNSLAGGNIATMSTITTTTFMS